VRSQSLTAVLAWAAAVKDDAPMSTDLDQAEFVTALDAWVGAEVALRVVVGEGDLLSISRGRLGARGGEKRPAWFWPLGDADPRAEQPGIYLHPSLFEHACLHTGEFVLELRQAGVTLNLRRV
jgi:hypothetical protein